MLANAPALHGVVRGRTIELVDETGLPNGQQVTVTLQPVTKGNRCLPPGEGIRRSEGGWDDDPEGLEAYLEWNRQQRKVGRPPIEDSL